MRWDADEAIAMHVIAASIPNSVFTNKTATKDVWDALKAAVRGPNDDGVGKDEPAASDYAVQRRR